MKPYFTTSNLICEECDEDINIGYEFLMHDNMPFHDEECLITWFMENSNIQKHYLTDDKTMREGM